MAENDIYNNQGKYERFKANLNDALLEPLQKDEGSKRYYCKNSKNLEYFKQLFSIFEARDISYVRRNRLIDTLKLIVHTTEKDLKKCEREDINQIVAFMHSRYKSAKSKSDFIKDTKHIWRTLFPEKDEKGRIDDTIIPYAVRHLSIKIDKSKEKRRHGLH